MDWFVYLPYFGFGWFIGNVISDLFRMGYVTSANFFASIFFTALIAVDIARLTS